MTEDFQRSDLYCLKAFPELLEQFTEEELRSASAIGTYIFHEDYFAEFIALRANSEEISHRIARYIEYLASAEDMPLRTLAEIGILEGLVSKEDHRLAPFLGPESRKMIVRLLPQFRVDPKPWLRSFKH